MKIWRFCIDVNKKNIVLQYYNKEKVFINFIIKWEFQKHKYEQ